MTRSKAARTAGYNLNLVMNELLLSKRNIQMKTNGILIVGYLSPSRYKAVLYALR